MINKHPLNYVVCLTHIQFDSLRPSWNPFPTLKIMHCFESNYSIISRIWRSRTKALRHSWIKWGSQYLRHKILVHFPSHFMLNTFQVPLIIFSTELNDWRRFLKYDLATYKILLWLSITLPSSIRQEIEVLACRCVAFWWKKKNFVFRPP